MIITKKNIAFGGDFNLIFDCKFDHHGLMRLEETQY